MGIVSILLGAIFLILVGVTWAGWATISLGFLGVCAIVVGVVWIVENLLWPRFGNRTVVRRTP